MLAHPLHLFLPLSEVLPALILASPCGALHPPLLFFGHQGHDERYFQHHGCAEAWPPSLPDFQLATVIKRRFLVLGTECSQNQSQMPSSIFVYTLIFKPSHSTEHSVWAVIQREKLTKNTNHISGCCFLSIYRLSFYCISSYLKLIPLF